MIQLISRGSHGYEELDEGFLRQHRICDTGAVRG